MIACAGDALIDFVPAQSSTGDEAFVPRVGGSALNVATALARLDAPASLIAGVSTDLFGEMIESHLLAAGVDIGLLTRSNAETTLAFVKMDGDDARYAFYDEHSAGRRWTYNAADLSLHGMDALHVCSVPLIHEPSASNYEQLVADARAHTVVSFDPNCRPTLVSDVDEYRARMARIAAMSHLVRFSEEDFEFLYPSANESDVAQTLLAGEASAVFITRGAGGASAYGKAGRTDVPAVNVKVVDTIGAGDTFQAGLLASLLECGMLRQASLPTIDSAQLAEAMEFAISAAAITCTRIGCDPPLRAELR